MEIRQWNLPPEPQTETVEALAVSCNISPLLARILIARGFDTPEKALAVLVREGKLSSPYLLKDMDKAVARIRLALERGERIAIYGDYDCDGITSTVLLTGYLQTVGADVIYYVPSREAEGYGMNMGAVDSLRQLGVSLIVTVDNGISAHDEIAYAKSLGIDAVVTDHHIPRETLPQAVAVVDPHRRDCVSGMTELAGVGVAFKLICALEEDEDGLEMLEYYADLVMIGTVADVVPLRGENRVIVSQGLIHLAQTERIGLAALLDRCGIGEKEPTAETVAYTIAPRLNAVGRMGCVDDAIELLLTDDARYAVETAETVDQYNARRKEVEESILAEIDGMIAATPELTQERLFIVGGEGWHHGVVGIVASRMMERLGKPTIIFSFNGDEVRGSARSLPGFSMIEAISACSEHLTRFGGHPLAAGMSMLRENYSDFVAQIRAYARTYYPLMPWQSIPIDCVLAPHELNVDTIVPVSALEPFGEGNRSPQFLIKGLCIDRVLPTADKKHLRLHLIGDNGAFHAVYFQMTEDAFPYFPGDTVDIVAQITAKPYNNRLTLSVVIQDLRMSDVPQEEIIRESGLYACHRRGEYDILDNRKALRPERDDVAIVYRYLRHCPGGFRHGPNELYYRLMGSGITYARMMIALDVMLELGLITCKNSAGQDGYFCSPNPVKVELEASKILIALQS